MVPRLCALLPTVLVASVLPQLALAQATVPNTFEQRMLAGAPCHGRQGRGLDDEQVAAVVTCLRPSWGNNAPPTWPVEVGRSRGVPADGASCL